MNEGEALRGRGWRPEILKRRLRLWELYGLGMNATAAVRQVTEEVGVAERQIWNDWSEVRKVLAELAAPKMEEIRARIAARYERVTSLASRQIAMDQAQGRGVSPQLLLRIETSQDRLAELYGVTNRNMILAPAPAKDDLADLSTQELLDLAARERDLLASIDGSDGDDG